MVLICFPVLQDVVRPNNDTCRSVKLQCIQYMYYTFKSHYESHPNEIYGPSNRVFPECRHQEWPPMSSALQLLTGHPVCPCWNVSWAAQDGWSTPSLVYKAHQIESLEVDN